MEAFSLLKFWKSSPTAVSGLVTPLPAAETTLLAAGDDDEAEVAAAGDDGPFFDLEFSDEDDDAENPLAELVCVAGEGGESEEEAGPEEDERTDPNLPVDSPSGDILKVIAVESGSDPNSGKPPAFPVSLLRSATRLRILMSGLKKSSKPDQAQPGPKKSRRTRKLFTIRFKPANGVVSSFSSSASTSSTSSSSSSSLKPSGDSDQRPPATEIPDEKRNPKDGVQKYIQMVKPLYIRVSKRYGEKLRFSGQFSFEKPGETPPEKSPEKQESVKESEKRAPASLGVGLKVMMRKRMSGKAKTAETGVVQPTATSPAVRQRDDSLIQQQEWIQGAIMHCKKSFNSSREENEDSESESILTGSSSDPLDGKAVEETGENFTELQNDVVEGR